MFLTMSLLLFLVASRYDEDEEDGPSDCTRSSSDSEGVFDEDEDEEVLEIRTPSSRRSSNSSSDGTYRASSVRSQTPISQVSSALEQHAQARSSLLDERSTTSSGIGQQDSRPSFRDSGRPGRGRGSAKFSHSSRSKSGRAHQVRRVHIARRQETASM